MKNKTPQANIIEIDLDPDAGFLLSKKASELILARIKKGSDSIKTAVMINKSPSSKRGSWLAKGNLALVPTTADVIIVNLPKGKLPVKKMYFYQFSGIVTTPADNGHKQFFKRAVQDFLSFILFPVHFIAKLWIDLFKFVLGQGDPASIAKGWIGESDLEKIAYKIPKVHNPKTPKSFLPSVPAEKSKYSPAEAGLGIWVQPNLNDPRLIALIDPKRKLSAQINKHQHDVIYKFTNGYPKRVLFSWLSNRYSLNDGSCYGSFIYSQNNN